MPDPQPVDYEALAREAGGSAIDATAAEFGGVPVDQTAAEATPDFSTRTTPADGISTLDRIEQASSQVIGPAASRLMRMNADLNVGAAKGAANTVVSLSRLGTRLPGMKALMGRVYGLTPEQIDAQYAAVDAALTPTNTTQAVGRTGEQIAETLLPGRMVTKAGVALAGALPRGMQTAGRMLVEGTGGAGMATAQGSNPTIAGALGAGLTGAGAVVKAVAPKVAPVMTEAMEFAQRRGIPVDAATATGSRVIRSMQDILGRGTLGGGLVRNSAENAREGAMARTAGALADEAHPAAVVIPEIAGQGSRDAVGDVIEDSYREGRKAYAELDRIAALPANTKRVQVGTRTVDLGVLDAQGQKITRSVPVTEDIALPTDLKALKQQFAPVRELMEQTIPPAQRNASPGYLAVKNILDGKDVVPAAVAEVNLSLLKDIAREAPEMQQTLGQGIASRAVSALEDAVQKAVAAGGPAATAARDAGRAAWRAKFDAAAVLKKIREEPRQAFDQAVYARDAGIKHLREVARLAPGEMPKIGRAYLEDLFTKATEKGGFGREEGLFRSWQNLGPETKKLLFPNTALRHDLNSFFLLATKAAENSNKSGSGFTAMLGAQGAWAFADPTGATLAQIPAAAVAKLLHSSRGVRLLTQGLKLPTLDKATAANVLEQLRRAGARTAATSPAATPADPASARAGAAR